ncbi:hypothetical protein NLJ89_g11757 [Agrocybe chaxingu]|uniref:Uncharacterized protein n=1 Tax=Agrocybe chaxingu TaxID=84603 RepID=A0A9W8MP38_9AGAR|nr:hypothetical protein NLJ89_g11757 [Agrocybe chaxingu]
MFWSSLACLSLIATSYASPLSRRAEGISVEIVPTATSVSSIADLKFTANIKNTGLEAVRILNYGTILDSKLPTKSFVVTKDGAAVAFTGVKVSVSLTDADDSAYTVINAGETLPLSSTSRTLALVHSPSSP